jgi:hypothetical protein
MNLIGRKFSRDSVLECGELAPAFRTSPVFSFGVVGGQLLVYKISSSIQLLFARQTRSQAGSLRQAREARGANANLA